MNLHEPAFDDRRVSGFNHIRSPTNHFTRGHLDESASAQQRFASWIEVLRNRLGAFPEGEHVAAAISRHFSEVRRLINSNRRIATMWHRATGPRLLRRLLQGTPADDGLLRTDEASASHYLDRCLELVAQQGSSRLRTSLDRYRSFVIRLLANPGIVPSTSGSIGQT